MELLILNGLVNGLIVGGIYALERWRASQIPEFGPNKVRPG